MLLLIYLIYFLFLLPNLIYVKVSRTRIHYVVKCNLDTFYWHTVIQSFLSISPIISSYSNSSQIKPQWGKFPKKVRIRREGGMMMLVSFYPTVEAHDNGHFLLRGREEGSIISVRFYPMMKPRNNGHFDCDHLLSPTSIFPSSFMGNLLCQ